MSTNQGGGAATRLGVEPSTTLAIPKSEWAAYDNAIYEIKTVEPSEDEAPTLRTYQVAGWNGLAEFLGNYEAQTEPAECLVGIAMAEGPTS